MGTLQTGRLWTSGSMAKLLCLLAWAGLTIGAPYQRVDNTELIVEKVMGSLGPQLDSAIEAAILMLEGNTGTGTGRSEAVVHSTNVAVKADGEEEIIEVVIDQLGPSISSAVEAALGSSSQDEARAKAEAEAAAIEAALNAEQGKADAIAKAEAEAIAKAEAEAAAAAESEAAEAAAFEQEFNQFTSSVSTKTTEGDLVGQVIAALTPSITEAVKAALGGQSQTTTVTITQQAQAEAEAQAAALAEAEAAAAAEAEAAQAAAQKKQAIVQQVLTALTSQVEAAVMSA